MTANGTTETNDRFYVLQAGAIVGVDPKRPLAIYKFLLPKAGTPCVIFRRSNAAKSLRRK
jgi:hypothetical protein